MQTIPTHYVQQFATNVQLLLQQKDSRLRAAVTEKSGYKGKQVSPVDQIGIGEMNEVNSRFAPIQRTDLPLDRRWVVPKAFDMAVQLDNFDQAKLLNDPKNGIVEAMVAAAKRRMDRSIIAAFFADALTGEAAGTTTSFPATQVVAVNEGSASNCDLSVAKLKKAKKILMANEVDIYNDPLYCAITASQNDKLLDEIRITSLDFNDAPVLKEGLITRFLGINFIHTELLSADSNSYRRVPVWAKSGMHLAIWEDMTFDISQLKNVQGLPWQAYEYLMINATRLEEKKVVEIKCYES